MNSNFQPSKHAVTKIAKDRTYGECIQMESDSIEMVDGMFRVTLRIVNKPKRMSREDALRYYSKKLREIWS